ncbi:MAG TPA: hypothetical protein PLU44_11355 [Candidatus Krumholzibacteria bacterium]|nr:hypothetical protein [Candidatus Krumholzibacteria bacterium]
MQEALAGEIVGAVIQVGLIVALVLFARSTVLLFARHGARLSPWYPRLCVALILVCGLIVARRFVGRIREIRALRAELAAANQKLRDLRDESPPRSDD